MIQFIHAKNISRLRLRFVRNGTVLISPYFPKARAEITAFIITDSYYWLLLLRCRKLVCCKQQPLKKILATWMTNHPLHHLPYPVPITITSIPLSPQNNKTLPSSPVNFFWLRTPFFEVFFVNKFPLIQVLSFGVYFLGCILLFEFVESRDINLNVNIKRCFSSNAVDSA